MSTSAWIVTFPDDWSSAVGPFENLEEAVEWRAVVVGELGYSEEEAEAVNIVDITSPEAFADANSCARCIARIAAPGAP